MEQTKYDVFISYSRKDYVDEQKNVIPGNEVSKIKDALSKAGITYWFDEEGIYYGQNFVEKIVTNIENARIFLFLSTANANKSSWTCKEIASADEFKKHIIPVRIDSTPYNKKVLFRIADLDYIEYYTNPQKGLEDLLKSIKTYLNEFAAEEERKKEEENRQKELERKREEEKRQQKEQEEKRRKEEQEQLIANIKVSCTTLNNEETKLELDRTNLLLSTEKITDLKIRDGLKWEIVESSPIRKKSVEGYGELQEKYDDILSSIDALEKENERLKVHISDLQFALTKKDKSYQDCVKQIEKSSANTNIIQKKLAKTTEELELARRGIMKSNKKIHLCYIILILLLLFGWYYTSDKLLDKQDIIDNVMVSEQIDFTKSDLGNGLSDEEIAVGLQKHEATERKEEKDVQNKNVDENISTSQEDQMPSNTKEHAYVDLGLSVLWASCNVGANSPEEFGEYYAWGEISTKKEYTEDNYKWFGNKKKTEWGYQYQLTKYNSDSYYGRVDNKNKLDNEDDVAIVKWGNGWRMPTYKEWNELRKKCSWKWTCIGNVYGYRVTSPANNNSIFLPAAGEGGYKSQVGHYWASTMSQNTNNPNSIDFNENGKQLDYYPGWRASGYSVRPVKTKESVDGH